MTPLLMVPLGLAALAALAVPLLIRRSYFDRTSVNYDWEGLPLSAHHHTFSDLFTGLSRANFRVDTVLEPEVIMTMDADTAHKFWLGKVNVTMALAKGQMKAKGPVAKILKLVPLAKSAFPRYRQMLADAGRADLQEA